MRVLLVISIFFSFYSLSVAQENIMPQEGGANIEKLEGWLNATRQESGDGIKKAREAITQIVKNQKIINEARQRLNSNPGTGPIYKHLRGNDGIAFDVVDIDALPVPAKPDDAEKYTKELMDVRMKYYQELMKPAPTLPPCTSDKTEKEDTDIAQNSRKGELLFDMLFVKEGDIPLNLQEALGDKTQIITYKAEKKDPLSYATVGIGVECLPYRIRVVQGAIFRDTGKNALKNYLDNQFGKGKDLNKVRTTAREKKSK